MLHINNVCVLIAIHLINKKYLCEWAICIHKYVCIWVHFIIAIIIPISCIDYIVADWFCHWAGRGGAEVRWTEPATKRLDHINITVFFGMLAMAFHWNIRRHQHIAIAEQSGGMCACVFVCSFVPQSFFKIFFVYRAPIRALEIHRKHSLHVKRCAK